MNYKNIVETRKLNDKRSKLGRNGDVAIRYIDGEPSHVTALEASLIDSYGKSAEAFVKDVGAGTINPYTGLKEYQPNPFTGGQTAANTELPWGATFDDYDAIKDMSRSEMSEYLEIFNLPADVQEYLTQFDPQALADLASEKEYEMEGLDIKSAELGRQISGQTMQARDEARMAASKSGFATSGTVQGKMQDQLQNLAGEYRTGMGEIQLGRERTIFDYEKGVRDEQKAQIDKLHDEIIELKQMGFNIDRD